MSLDQKNAWQCGFDFRGKKEKCPYPKGSDEWKDWLIGRNAAIDDYFNIHSDEDPDDDSKTDGNIA